MRQPIITQYFKVINEIQILCAANKELSIIISELLLEKSSKSSENENHSFVLNCLVKAAAQQSLTDKKSGYRHENPMKDLACYIFMLGGRLNYETLYLNLPLPSPTSVGRYLHDNGPQIVEGVMRCHQLKKYLHDRNLPATVWISEDGTRITGRLQYDPGTNQIVGLVLPLNEHGVPKSNSFLATSVNAMQTHLKNPVASIVSFDNFIYKIYFINFVSNDRRTL